MPQNRMALALVALFVAAATAPAAARTLREAAAAPAAAPAVAPSDGIPMTKEERAEIAALFDAWNAALQTGDPEKVADMYAEESVLLPTVSNEVRPDRASKVDYFTSFLTYNPKGTIDESYIRWLSPNKDVAANSGIYTFDLVKDGDDSEVQARYTYVYKKVDGEWKIAEHHSSVMPEPEAGP